ncbi:MAG: cell adhesion protein [Spirochaetes bacterium]|nr:cell adhesion protein [Spirochaetota bacterium]
MKKNLLLLFISLIMISVLFNCTVVPDTDQTNEESLVEASNNQQEEYGNEEIASSARSSDYYLDYGIYWFDSSNNSVKGYDNGQVLSVGTDYYSNSKKTLIYFHGWQKGTSTNNYWRENFHFYDSSEGINEITVTAWKNAGWNVGIFYWNQFADEDELTDAEAKIWSANGPKGMRYRQSDGNYKGDEAGDFIITDSVGELAFAQLKEILKNNNSHDIRFVGHSLGNQLATNVAKMFSDAVQSGTIPSRAMPDRLDILDPFWSKNGKSFLGGDWVGERVRKYISTMISRHNIASSWYKTTAILDLWIGDSNQSLEGIIAFIEMKYWYLSSWEIDEKHKHAPNMYFWTYAYDVPKEYTSGGTYLGRTGPSAKTSNSRITEMMGNQYSWDHSGGRYTPNPGDDTFTRHNY